MNYFVRKSIQCENAGDPNVLTEKEIEMTNAAKDSPKSRYHPVVVEAPAFVNVFAEPVVEAHREEPPLRDRITAAGSGDLQGAFGDELTCNIAEVAGGKERRRRMHRSWYAGN